MKHRRYITAIWHPMRASFDLAPAERRLLLGVLLLFLLGLGARWHYLHTSQPNPVPAAALEDTP